MYNSRPFLSYIFLSFYSIEQKITFIGSHIKLASIKKTLQVMSLKKVQRCLLDILSLKVFRLQKQSDFSFAITVNFSLETHDYR